MASFMIDKETGLPKKKLGLKPLLDLEYLTDIQRDKGIKILAMHYANKTFSQYASDIQKVINAGFTNFNVHIRLSHYWALVHSFYPDGAKERLLTQLFVSLCGVHYDKALSFLSQHKLYNEILQEPMNQVLLRRVLVKNNITPQLALRQCKGNTHAQALILQMM